MSKYIKIGQDVFNLEAVTRITLVEARSGISDRIVITLGESEVIVDSALGGRARMDQIQARLMAALGPEDWDQVPQAAQSPTVAPRSSSLFRS